jgi:hypothetical protein
VRIWGESEMPATLAKQVKLAAYKNLQMKRRDKWKTVGEILCRSLSVLPPARSSQTVLRLRSQCRRVGLLQLQSTTWESCA